VRQENRESVVGIVLLLRDVLARSLFKKYQRDFGLLSRVLDPVRAGREPDTLTACHTACRAH